MKNPLDLLPSICAFEEGALSDDDTITLFQDLIDNGMVWRLQGRYGRTAMDLISSGLCHPATEPTNE